MKYVSTQGRAPVLGFADVLLAGLAADGGLYVPETWPALPPLAPRTSYASAAAEIMWPYVEGDLGAEDFRAIVADAYKGFGHPSVCPLVQLGDNEWLLELFHGPTLAFKDVALQLVGRLFDHVLAERGERIMIVTATSGDTGPAAIEGVRRSEAIDIVVLYPAGRVSDVQRRQMTTVEDANVHPVAVDGTFDDCQDLVKAMLADDAFRERHRLSAANSINWARVMAQAVYYVTAAQSLAGGPGGRPIRFSVPTGNFGNALAGWMAHRSGLPVEQLVIGSNRNDILTRLLASGLMTTSVVVPTLSPSMDIQVSSNFERLLFELNHRDGGLTAEQLHRFRATGSLALEADQLDVLTSVFAGARCDDDRTVAVIAETYREAGLLVDPHTAVGIEAARVVTHDPDVPTVVLATAHPAKFPDAVALATGVRPPLPAHLADLFERPERSVALPNDLAAVQAYLGSLARP